ncbi:MAG: rRNA maturation RNase YbeY [Pseudomonadota bacterium]
MSPEPEILIEEPAWAALSPDILVAACVAATKATTADPSLARVVTALFTTDAAVRALNAEWREKDKPTNVLSFPAEPVPGLPDAVQPLGDLALAYQTCAREAADKGITLKDHTTHLIVHGVLHLLGYDHIGEDEAEAMEALEIKILARLGINNPY